MSAGEISRRQTLALLAASVSFGPGAARAFASPGPGEPPLLADLVASGALPPTADRLPLEPRIIDLPALGRRNGRHGGTIRMLIGGQRDVRFVPINGYSRLVGYNGALVLKPDILRAFEVEDGRIFTLHLRHGHRWSDGHPFTTEDFRYCWQDVLQRGDLGGMPPELLIDGQGPEVEILDEITIRYSWPLPQPDFLPSLAAPSPLRLFMPAHYLRGFHAAYTPKAELDRLVKQYRMDDWQSLHQKMSRITRPENPDLPTLEPWRPRTAPPAQQFVFERNPYFHRVDTLGQQLPYVDRLLLNVSGYDIIPAKVATGESDLQPFGLDFSDYTLVKEAERRFAIRATLWLKVQGARVALLPNLTCADPGWRTLYRDVRVRRAFSLAIDRTEINKALFFGLARESANTVLAESPLFRPEYATAWAGHDPEQANALLDQAGLSPIGRDGFRHLPDGRMAGIIVETSGETTMETDVLELVAEHMRAVGIALWTRNSQRDLFRSRAMAGLTSMAVGPGLDNGVPTGDMAPTELAPTADDQMIWPQWGVHYASHGVQGHAPDLPAAQELLTLLLRWRLSRSSDEKVEIWHRMLSIHADQVFTIGIINGTSQPMVRAARLQNMPKRGMIGFQPTSLLGVYMPDTFWYDEAADAGDGG